MRIIPVIYEALYTGKRQVILQGGTGAGKTFAVMQYLLAYANNHQGAVISVVGESMPVLRRGPMRDLKRILELQETNLHHPSAYRSRRLVKENKTQGIFKIGASIIEFFSARDSTRLRGPKRDILFINECNKVSHNAFMELDSRTKLQTILDFNPVRRFWVHDNLLPYLTEKEHVFLKCTYKDNPFLSYDQIRNIERNKHLANWWRVYGEGEIGETEGTVFNNWTIIQGATKIKPVKEFRLGDYAYPTPEGSTRVELPGKLLGFGVDFGFTHSPTALVQVHEFNGELYVHELLYRTGIHNEELLDYVQKHIDVRALAAADCASPQNIDFLIRNGWYGLKAAKKGDGSVLFGLDLLLQRKINVTAESQNLINELRNYVWDTDLKGNLSNNPVKEFDHSIDALRYIVSYAPRKKLTGAGD